MTEALVTEDFDRVARVAHKLKGSLGCLHASRSRLRAQALEAAAKNHDAVLCAGTIEALELDLDGLQGELSAFRQSLLER